MPITVKYCIDFDTKTIEEIELPVNSEAADLLEQVNNKHHRFDLIMVYIDGQMIELDDLIRNHLTDTEAFAISVKELQGLDIPRVPIDPPAPVPPPAYTVTSTNPSVSLSLYKKEFTVFTTATEHSFFTGDPLVIQTNKESFDQIHDKIMELIRGFKSDKVPADFEIHIFLPGGIPYLSGQVDELMLNCEIFHFHFYVIVTSPLGDIVNQTIPEPCSCKGIMQQLLSPLIPSTPAGLTQVASLLGYFYHNGLNGEHIFLVLAKIGFHFAPFFINIYRLLEQAELTGLNIIAITSGLFRIFRQMLNDDIADENVFEHTLKCIAYISLVKDTEFLKLVSVNLDDDVDENDENYGLIQYFKTTNQQNHMIFWEDDLDEAKSGFEGFEVTQPDPESLDSIFEIGSYLNPYKPVLPLSLHYLYHPAFIQGADPNGVMLFLKEVPYKKDTIKYIDPSVGIIEEIELNALAAKTGAGRETTDIDSLIDSERVDQLIYICIDESRSMKFRLIGGNPRNGELSRAQIASQLLHAFVEQSYKLRVSSLYGLIAFGDQPRMIQKLTPLSEEFIKKLEEITPNGKTHLFDAVKLACDNLIAATQDDEDDPELYPNALKRIIMITDGEDNKSEANPASLINTLIANDIKVDTVLISSTDRSNQCCAMSQMTAGLCYQPNSLEEGLKMFEQEAFINIKRRHLTKPYAGTVTMEAFQTTASKFREFDNYAPNQEILNAKQVVPLSTPFNMVYEYRKNPVNSFRLNRAVRELNDIGHHPNDNFVVYSFSSSATQWRVFIKGPAGTPYANKYLNLYVYLPPSYPSVPPQFRFLTVPYHPNVSAEGAVMFSMINKDYESRFSLSTLLQGIVDILSRPDMDSAINPEAMNLCNSDRAAFTNKQRSEPTGEANYQSYISGATIATAVPEVPADEPVIIDQIYMTTTHGTRGKILNDDDDDEFYY